MKFAPDQYQQMASVLHGNAKAERDPEKAKKIEAMANTYRQLAKRAAKQKASAPRNSTPVTSSQPE